MISSLRLLLWLKWTLTWRGYRRSRSKVFGAVIFLLAFVPLSGFCAYGLWALEGDYPSLALPLARDALTLVFLLWAATPLLGFPLNESFDLTRLFVYPVSPARLFVGALLGGLMDRAVLLVLPLLLVLLGRTSATPPACGGGRGGGACWPGRGWWAGGWGWSLWGGRPPPRRPSCSPCRCWRCSCC